MRRGRSNRSLWFGVVGGSFVVGTILLFVLGVGSDTPKEQQEDRKPFNNNKMEVVYPRSRDDKLERQEEKKEEQPEENDKKEVWEPEARIPRENRAGNRRKLTPLVPIQMQQHLGRHHKNTPHSRTLEDKLKEKKRGWKPDL